MKRYCSYYTTLYMYIYVYLFIFKADNKTYIHINNSSTIYIVFAYSNIGYNGTYP